jgi:predicted transcriptional regulator
MAVGVLASPEVTAQVAGLRRGMAETDAGGMRKGP